jgi:hypothetical protein
VFVPNAVEGAEARVTIRNMGTLRWPRPAALGFALILFVGCGDSAAGGGVSASTADHKASQALLAIDELRNHSDQLAERISELENQRSDVKDRIGRIAGRLHSAIASLRESVDARRNAVDAANSAADDALAQAQSALEGLAVLQHRFDYHLKHDHGEG